MSKLSNKRRRSQRDPYQLFEAVNMSVSNAKTLSPHLKSRSSSAAPAPEENNDTKQVAGSESSTVVNRNPIYKLWQLIPFFRRVIIYFTVEGLQDYGKLNLPNWARLIFKILPVLTLCVFIVNQYDTTSKFLKSSYAVLMFLGMLTCSIGDSLLVYQDNSFLHFLGGLLSFATAHIFYAIAFGTKPSQFRILLRSVVDGGLIYWYLYSQGLAKTEASLIGGVGFYVCVIMAMQWRAWARVSYEQIRQGRIYALCGAFGATLFVLSDLILGVNKFAFEIPGSNYIILGTYYLSQMLIALSVVDGRRSSWTHPDVDSEEDETERSFLETAIRWFVN